MTLSDPAASGGEKLPLAELNGALLLIKVNDHLSGDRAVDTVHGRTEPIAADVHVLDGTHKGEVYDDTLIFPKMLVGSLKSKVGEWVAVRLGQGVAKPGKSAPWMFNVCTADDKKVAEAAYAKLTAPVEVEGF
jgi:hypothetical protein